MDNGRIVVTDNSQEAAAGMFGNNSGVSSDLQTTDKCDIPRFRLLTRPTQTVPVTLPTSLAAQVGNMAISDSSTSQHEDTLAEEVPLEGLEEGLYDLADPSVNLHEFIVDCLSTPKDRLFLLHLEKDLIEFIEDDSRDLMEFPSMTSYHRMLLHRVAAYFGLEHNVNPSGQSVIISKAISTRLPKMRFVDLLPSGLSREETASPKLILKRNTVPEVPEVETTQPAVKPTHGSDSMKKSKTMAEREAEYERARARIFSQPTLVGEQTVNSSNTETKDLSSLNVTECDEVPSAPVVTTDFVPVSNREDTGIYHTVNVSKESQHYKPDIAQIRQQRLPPMTSTFDDLSMSKHPADFSTHPSFNPQHTATGLHYPGHMVPVASESVHPLIAAQAAMQQQAQMMALLQAQQSLRFPNQDMVPYPFSDTTDTEAMERESTRQLPVGFPRVPPVGHMYSSGIPCCPPPMAPYLGQVPVTSNHGNERSHYNLQQQQQQQLLLQHQQYHHLQQLEQQRRFQRLQRPPLPYRSPGIRHFPDHPGINKTHSPSPLDANSDRDSGGTPTSLYQRSRSRPDFTVQPELRSVSLQRQERRDHPVKAYSAQRPGAIQSAVPGSGNMFAFALEIYEIQGNREDIKNLVSELHRDGGKVWWQNKQSPLKGGLAIFKSHAEMQAALMRARQQPTGKYKLRVPGKQLLQSFSHLSVT